METFKIQGTHITMGQLLKVLDYIASGGEAKSFLLINEVFVQGKRIFERNKKLLKDDLVSIKGKKIVMV